MHRHLPQSRHVKLASPSHRHGLLWVRKLQPFEVHDVAQSTFQANRRPASPLNEIGKIWSVPGQYGSNLAQCGPSLVESSQFRENVARCSPKSCYFLEIPGRSRPKLVEFGPTSPKFGRHFADSGGKWLTRVDDGPHVGRYGGSNFGEINRLWHDLGQTRPASRGVAWPSLPKAN